MSADPILCFCYGVKRKAVLEHFAKPGATLEELVEQTKIATKCTACALDLDIVLDDIHGSKHHAHARAAAVAESGRGWVDLVDRIDSGFFLCNDQVKTHVRLANYPPLSNNEMLCTPHGYRLSLFDNDGRLRSRVDGVVAASAECTINLSKLPNCPAEGWFHLHLKPQGTGRYGTLRPQVALEGKYWAACYHTQFHADAAKAGRRSGTALRTVGELTRTVISVINGSSRPSHYWGTVTGGDFHREIEGHLNGNGAKLLDIDAEFSPLPRDANLIFRIRSEQPTRKNLINRHPDGSLGVDHFPNLV